MIICINRAQSYIAQKCQEQPYEGVTNYNRLELIQNNSYYNTIIDNNTKKIKK